MLRFIKGIHFSRSFGNTPRIFRAICIAAQILHLLIFPQFTVTLSELGAFTLYTNVKCNKKTICVVAQLDEKSLTSRS